MKRPALKVSQLGVTWNSLRQKKMNLPPGMAGTEDGTEEHQSFTAEDLELQWMGMCNRMPQQYSGLAARMKNMNPTILEIPAVEVVVPNEIIKAEMDAIQRKIVSTLKLYLHNSDITLTLRVAEQKEREQILTRKQQFEVMSSQNPSVEKLREAFDLQLA